MCVKLLANLKIVSDSYFDYPYAPGDAGGSIGSASHFLSTKYQGFENLDNPYIEMNLPMRI